MILSDIKHYLIRHKLVTLNDLTIHFDTDSAAMKGMIDVWVQKGRVIKTAHSAPCKKACVSCCNQDCMEIYQWKTAND